MEMTPEQLQELIKLADDENNRGNYAEAERIANEILGVVSTLPQGSKHDLILFRAYALNALGIAEVAAMKASTGKDETIEGWQGAQPYHFFNVSREDRLASELGAYFEEDGWSASRYDIEWYLCAQRLGLNLACYFLNTNDAHYFSRKNEHRICTVQILPLWQKR